MHFNFILYFIFDRRKMTFQHRPDVRETIRMCHSWNGTIARCKPFPKRKRLELDKDENMVK